MADVFISYHEKSAGELAAQIAETLEAGGISCWYAKRDIPTGGDFARTIPPQIDACKVFLLILNENAQHSKHIESELGLAFSRSNHGEDITIFPVEIGDFEKEPWIKYYLIHAQILKILALDTAPFSQVSQEFVWKILAMKIVSKLLNEVKLLTPTKVEPYQSPLTKINGKCGDNVTYTLENGVLTISGYGAMWDFRWDTNTQIFDNPWWDEHETISHVEIQHGITTIGNRAFYECKTLKSINIPDSLTHIGDRAFFGCSGLTSVYIPDNVISIGDSAFDWCGRLKSANIPQKTILCNEAFWHTTRVTRRT